MERFLLTGGRAGATLDLARFLRRAGHAVHVAESWPTHLTGSSRAVDGSHRVRAPRESSEGFVEDLRAIVEREGITRLVPTCEEVFAVSRHAHLLRAGGCQVWVDSLPKLSSLHDKGAFNSLARELGLDVPATRIARDPGSLRSAIDESSGPIVLKPAFSRFASSVLFSDDPGFRDRAGALSPSELDPWLVQDRARGEEVCTYSVARDGRLLAHACYSHEFTAGRGAGICFEAVDRPAVDRWVERLVAATSFTGQIAFDFILEDGTGRALALECNPRATSGIHLFAEVPAFARVFADPAAVAETVRPRPGTLGTVTRVAMILYGLGQIDGPTRAREWTRVMLRARDALFRFDDPMPFIEQFRTLYRLWRTSRSTGRTLLQETTSDIEWNGER